jgi:hypothetical protein
MQDGGGGGKVAFTATLPVRTVDSEIRSKLQIWRTFQPCSWMLLLFEVVTERSREAARFIYKAVAPDFVISFRLATPLGNGTP